VIRQADLVGEEGAERLAVIRHQVRQLPIGLVVRAVRVRDVVASVDGCKKRIGQRTRQRPDADEIVHRVTVREFPDGERRAIDSARPEHRGHARTVFEPRVEHRLALGVAACTRDVLDRDG
jgi:hypothetical protein